ncbi:hypothetical protein [Nostoc sp.]
MSLLRVERLNEHGNLKVLKPLWLAWVGEEIHNELSNLLVRLSEIR